MRLSPSLAILLVVALLPAPARADDRCRAIVTATIAELRAGAAAWDDAIEALARTAAGSACVKALSGNYAAGPAPAQGADQTVAAAAAPSSELATAAVAEQAAEDDETDAKKDGKAGWKFLGFEVNEVSGSPGKKPYERRRAQ